MLVMRKLFMSNGQINGEVSGLSRQNSLITRQTEYNWLIYAFGLRYIFEFI
jgi:hypothetical protein